MHVHPAIEALRSDPASQRRAQKSVTDAMAAWRENLQVQRLAGDVARYGDGAPLEECETLAGLLSDHRAAMAFARSWCADLIEPLSRAPLSEVHFRYRQSGGFSAVQLLRRGRATLGLAAYERQSEIREPKTARFIDVETTELIIAGSANGTLHRCIESGEATLIETSKRRWETGDAIAARSGEARQIVDVDGGLLVLQLTRTPLHPVETREFSLADSNLIKTASGNKQASADLMALSVLGALQHEPGLDVIDQIAIDPARDADLRWEAVRQSLALRADRGFATLCELAQRQTDRLSVPSINLREQLLAAHPQLAQFQAEAA